MAFVTSLIMTSRDQFLMTSDQFEIGDDQNWSQKPPGPEKTRHCQDRWTFWSRELSEPCILYMINGQNEKNHFTITLAPVRYQLYGLSTVKPFLNLDKWTIFSKTKTANHCKNKQRFKIIRKYLF